MFYPAIVILPSKIDKDSYYIKEAINDLLLPYWKHKASVVENIQCRCVGSQAMKDADRYLAQLFNVDELKTYIGYQDHNPEAYYDVLPVLFLMNEKRLEYFSETHIRYAPDPGCPICNGTGYETIYYNPKYKWDMYVIGGNYDGKIWGPERYEEIRTKKIKRHIENRTYSYDRDGHIIDEFEPYFRDGEIEDNCRIVSEIPIDDDDYVPRVLVTPDREWYEVADYTSPENMGSSVVDEQWRYLLKRECAKYPGHLAVMLECHR